MGPVLRLIGVGVLFLLALPAAADRRPSEPRTERHRHGEAGGQWRFGRLNLLPGEVMILHLDAYRPPEGRSSESCPVKIAFVAESDVLQEGDFTLVANRGIDVAFYGPTTGVVQVKPVITPYGRCNLEIVPLIQVQEQIPAGTGKTLYLYSGQPSVSLR